MRSLVSKTLALVVVAVLMALPTANAEDKETVQLIVGYKEGAEKFAGDLDYAERVDKRRDIEIIEVRADAAQAVKDTLRNREEVRFVEVNSNVKPLYGFRDPEPPIETDSGEPLFNSPGFLYQHYWASPEDSEESYHQGGAFIGAAVMATVAWQPPQIAVIDTGASIYDEGMEWEGGVNLVADDYPEDTGPDDWAVFPNFEDECTSREFHGQQVGSIMGAPQDNHHGIAGIMPDAEYYAVRVFPCRSDAKTSDIVDAIYWAAGVDPEREGIVPPEAPMDVMNLSLGSEGECTLFEQEAINQARANGVVVVAAAGNDPGKPPADEAPSNCEGVLTVTGSTREGDADKTISVGEGSDLAAQSYQVRTENIFTSEEGAYRFGTSFAAPIVSGLAALIRANVPGIQPEEIIAAIKESARSPNLSQESKEEGITASDLGAGIVDFHGAFRLLAGVGDEKSAAQLHNLLNDAECSMVGEATSQALEAAGEPTGNVVELIVNKEHDREMAVLFKVDDPEDSQNWQVAEASDVLQTEDSRAIVEDWSPDAKYGVQFCDAGEQQLHCEDEVLFPVQS